jgi:hypothetical protein
MQRWFAVVLLFCLPVLGCGSGPVQPSQGVSEWSGTYSGALNFKGCSTSPCTGDSFILTLTQSASFSTPGEFSPTVNVAGTDETTGKHVTGSGTALYTGAAPIGPGNGQATLTITTNLGSLFLSGSGSSTTKSPIVFTSIAVNNAVTINGATVKGPLYLGMLTRQ